MMHDEELTPGVEVEPSPRVVAAMAELKASMTALIAGIDAHEATMDDVAELLTRSMVIAETVRSLQEEVASRVLEWFRKNRYGHRDVVIGESRYFPERKKKVTLKDLPAAMRDLARARIFDQVMAATFGDEENAELLFQAIGDLSAAVVSSGGLKQGACKAVLGQAAEDALMAAKAEAKEDPPTEEELKQVAREAFLRHFEEIWPDKLASQDGEKETLGIANMRFLTRNVSDRHTKKTLQEMLTRAAAAREIALAAESPDPRAGSWDHAVEAVKAEDLEKQVEESGNQA